MFETLLPVVGAAARLSHDIRLVMAIAVTLLFVLELLFRAIARAERSITL
jgi:hypothetical protein